MRTKEEIDNLKQSWVRDPCWCIENTEGFEDYRYELMRFRLEKKKEWEQAARLIRCNDLGCSENLLSLIESLEARINELESRADYFILKQRQ